MSVELDRQGWRVLLSHHRADQLHLCYRLGGAHRALCLCARCVGLYPGLALALIVERCCGPWPWWLEWGLLFLAPLPAMVEWGLTVASGRSERSNPVRTATGLGLGVGLGTNLAVNARDLLGMPVLAQIAYFLAGIWVVWMISYGRRSGVRRRALRRRLRRPSLKEYVLGRSRPDDVSDARGDE